MATEVKHGPKPKFRAKLQPGAKYQITITGYYTRTDGLTAAGVSDVRWQSERPAKRQAETLGLRSAFVGWFLETYLENGGTWEDGVKALTHYPFAKVRYGLKRHRRKIVKRWARAPRWYERWAWAIREWRETPVNKWWRRR